MPDLTQSRLTSTQSKLYLGDAEYAQRFTGEVSFLRLSMMAEAEITSQLAACWNAVRDALAEYDKQDSTGQMLPRAADRMADILRSALNA